MRLSASLLVFSCLFGLACQLTGCASSDYDDLQRRYQLLQLENGNLTHEQDSLNQDLKIAKGDQAVLEDKANNLRQAVDAERRNNQSIREELRLAQDKLGQAQATVAKVRALVTSTTVPDRQLRAQLLQVLGPESPAGLPPVTLPQAPPGAAAPATH